MIKIAIINLKGGVGKSTTACNLALSLPCQRGKLERCLIVDLDKQGNASKFFRRHDPAGPGVDRVLLLPGTAGDNILTTDDAQTDIMPGNMRLLSANRQILTDCTSIQQNRLSAGLGLIQDRYEWCIMDCPPDIDMGTINALCAADWVIVPVDCGEWALDGLDEIMTQIQAVKQSFNPRLRLMGCLVTRYTRTKYSVAVVNALKDKGLPMLKTGIRQSTVVQQANAAGMSVVCYAPSSASAGDYKALAAEIVSIVDTVM